MAETSTKPYMIRALYEWCCDNGYTPYLAVVVDAKTIVPRQHVKGGEIVLNVSSMATSRLTLGNERVEFQARFSGVAQQLSIPIGNISAIYARETGHGMAFEVAKPVTVEGADGADDVDDASADRDDAHAGTAPGDDEGGDHSPASSVQSLRGGARRRGPRSVDPGAEAGQSPGDGEASHSRDPGAEGQASADVLAFLPSGAPRKKKGTASRSKTDETEVVGESARTPDGSPADDGEEPPPSDGGGQGGQGGKGSKARLTRVK